MSNYIEINQLCENMINLLEDEYLALQSSEPIDIADFLEQKRLLSTRMNDFMPEIASVSSEEAHILRPRMEKINHLSERNMIVLKGRIDGLQTIIDILKDRESTGTYGPDGRQIVEPAAYRVLETA